MTQVLALDQGGRPSRWASWDEALCHMLKGHVSWQLGETKTYRGGINRATGKDSVVYVPSIIALHNEVFDGRVALTNQNLFLRDDYTCCYCGQRYLRQKLSREHIVPVSRGGADSWTNCATACKSCNNRKGDRLLEHSGMTLLYVPYVPNRAEGLILEGRNILSDQLDFLRNCLPKASPLRTRSFQKGQLHVLH